MAFRGIFAEDANVCSLGMTFDRCRYCGLPYHDLAVNPGQVECNDRPCVGPGWAATPRASRAIPRALTDPRVGHSGRVLEVADV